MVYSSDLSRALLGLSLFAFLSNESIDLRVYDDPLNNDTVFLPYEKYPSYQVDHSVDNHNLSMHNLLNLNGDRNVNRWINRNTRKWGCHRKETPLIFVHIGKAGGGMIRARFAAAAFDYDRENWHAPRKDQHYYPVHKAANASFCNSMFKRYTIPGTDVVQKSFEGNLPCNATTPIGMALACPEPVRESRRCRGCQDLKSKHCHTIYMGHNRLGSELHWLPPKYLQNWWQSTPWKNNMTVDWKLVTPHDDGNVWCTTPNQEWQSHSRPTSTHAYRQLFQDCSLPIGKDWDFKFQTLWRALDSATPNHVPVNYSPIYASLPVQRVTMVREPWSWLVSKFFWHHGLSSEFRCDDLKTATDWAHDYALQGIVYFCGNDCGIRWDHNQMSLEELWIQSESNLRHAFTVVGLMNETNTFYEMLSTRVAYLNMSRNIEVQGKRHESGRSRETVRCHKVFQASDFQADMREKVPMIRLLEHLYHVAVEVNRFQLQELKECQGPKGTLWSTTHSHSHSQ